MYTKPTPSRWPGSIRLGHTTYITLDVPSVADQPGPSPNLTLDDHYILCEDYNAFTNESYASLTREYYTEQEP